ncbi:hypothetical protein ACFWBM_07380 [Streptomyces sp. NPDC059980]|uniref:hypothetical protein n=1 Tax=Streptomyces sp. NPDC059980 TaxID=3347022 RepID=UPI0036BA81B5
MSDYSMGYFGGGYAYDGDEYEEFEEQPQQRQQNAPKSPGLRAHMKAITTENKQLKQELEEQRAALAELMEGDGSQMFQPGPPRTAVSDAEVMQMQRMQSMGAFGTAAPSGSQAEQVSRIRNAKSPDELMEYLRSQGSVHGTMNYDGMGY